MTAGADYIVVGAGSAGAVMAARLSESADASVLLIEAGPDLRASETPIQFRSRNLAIVKAPGGEAFYWPGIVARRNRHQKPYAYSRGTGMGGSSTINGMCAIRGAREDFDGWERLGADGWAFADLLPAFVRLEDDHDFADAPYHGSGGPTPVYREPEDGWGGIDRALRAAAEADGHPWQADHNAPDAIGISPFAMNIRDGKRVSTNDGYLEPARGRPNLTILARAHVDRVAFEGDRAIGVVLDDGTIHHVQPGGDVVICAGAVHSPGILMRSGFGPASSLHEIGIDVRADLPVGEGIQDHAVCHVDIPVDEASQQSNGGRATNIVVRYSSGLPEAGSNDLMLLASNHNYWYDRPGSGVAVILNQVFSRGRLMIPSDNPHAIPAVDLAILEDERDRVRMEEAVRYATELVNRPAFASIATGPVRRPSRAEIPTFVKDVMHICGGCRMGSANDSHSVVDSNCRVLGTDGLRVVDASIMPVIPRANLHLTVVAMAEHAAARIAEGGAIAASAPPGATARA